MLLSSVCYFLILHNLIAISISTIDQLSGFQLGKNIDLNSHQMRDQSKILPFTGIVFGIIYYYLEIICITYIILTLTEMTILKVIYIYKFSRIAALDEYFLTRIIIFFNFVFITIFNTIRLALKEHETNPAFTNYKEQIHLHQLKVRTDEQDNIEM